MDVIECFFKVDFVKDAFMLTFYRIEYYLRSYSKISEMHIFLTNANWERGTNVSIIRVNLSANIFEIILMMQFIRLMGLKSLTK